MRQKRSCTSSEVVGTTEGEGAFSGWGLGGAAGAGGGGWGRWDEHYFPVPTHAGFTSRRKRILCMVTTTVASFAQLCYYSVLWYAALT